jgi:CRISPR-associated protein Csd1
LRGLRHHVADALKQGRGGWIDGKVGEIMAKLPPELPRTLRLEEQGRFAIGYYHERAWRRSRTDEADPSEEERSR